jgi:hypothetical protein
MCRSVPKRVRVASRLATVGNVKRYFIETSAPDAAELGDSLWNEDAATTRSNVNIVMDQYKLYVEMADRCMWRWLTGSVHAGRWRTRSSSR